MTTTKTQTMVKINSENTISVLTYNDGSQEVAHLANGEYSEAVLRDVLHFEKDSLSFEDKVQDLASEILLVELEKLGFSVRPEVEGQVEVECFMYNIWIAARLNGNKIVWDLSTIHALCEDEDKDKNKAARTTFKGLVNYLNRFTD